MTSLARFNPFRELTEPFNDDFFKGFALRPIYRLMDDQPQMKLDLTEDDKTYFVKAEMPGVHKDEIKVMIDGNQVSVTAETKKQKEEKEGAKTVRSERYCGKIFRSFTLDQSIDQATAVAKYEDGVLELTLPKKPGNHSKLLKIS